ncbi:MAG: DUF924 family protein [Desulfurellaceae bacterium]|nr:DUF924 family protein [Desulfurellaceae bacterium]
MRPCWPRLRPTGRRFSHPGSASPRNSRFPHRNVILGRQSTPDEQAFLDSGSGSFGQAPAAGADRAGSGSSNPT